MKHYFYYFNNLIKSFLFKNNNITRMKIVTFYPILSMAFLCVLLWFLELWRLLFVGLLALEGFFVVA